VTDTQTEDMLKNLIRNEISNSHLDRFTRSWRTNHIFGMLMLIFLPATSFNFLAICMRSGDDWTNIGDEDCLVGSPRKIDFLSILKDIVSSSNVQTANETLFRRL